MNRLQKASVITYLADRLIKHGSWSGETHLQKGMYFLQEVFRVDTDFGFVLYKHGPFSFDLRDEISELNADGLLALGRQPYPYGPSLVPTDRSRALWAESRVTIGRNQEAINAVAELLDRKGVADLERLATALFVINENPKASHDAVAARIVELKPHVSMSDALQAVSSLYKFLKRSSPQGQSAEAVRA